MLAMCSFFFATTRAMISPCSQLGWHGFLTWILTLGSKKLMGFLPLFFFRVGSSTSSFGCEKPI